MAKMFYRRTFNGIFLGIFDKNKNNEIYKDIPSQLNYDIMYQ